MKGKKRSDNTREKMSFAATIRWAKERNRRAKIRELQLALDAPEVDVAPANSLTEAYNLAGQAQ